jgi:hypothetical protein
MSVNIPRMLGQGLNVSNASTPKNYKNLLQEYYAKSVKTQPFQIAYVFSCNAQGLFESEVSVILNNNIENIRVYGGLPRSTKKSSEQSAAEIALRDTNNDSIVPNNGFFPSVNDPVLSVQINGASQNPIGRPSDSLSSPSDEPLKLDFEDVPSYLGIQADDLILKPTRKRHQAAHTALYENTNMPHILSTPEVALDGPNAIEWQAAIEAENTAIKSVDVSTDVRAEDKEQEPDPLWIFNTVEERLDLHPAIKEEYRIENSTSTSISENAFDNLLSIVPELPTSMVVRQY